MNNELFITDQHAECYEVKHVEKNNEPGLRIFQTANDRLIVQVMTYAGTAEFGKGVKRNMIAHAHIDVAEAVKLRDRLNDFIKKSK